jgi:hypothetical protein
MARRTFIPPPGCLKKRRVRSMKGCFKVSKCHANSFCASWASKKATWTKKLMWWLKNAYVPENS